MINFPRWQLKQPRAFGQNSVIVSKIVSNRPGTFRGRRRNVFQRRYSGERDAGTSHHAYSILQVNFHSFSTCTCAVVKTDYRGSRPAAQENRKNLNSGDKKDVYKMHMLKITIAFFKPAELKDSSQIKVENFEF